jgi:hypothetical protein
MCAPHTSETPPAGRNFEASRYGISDDAVREDTIDAASDEELTALVNRVDKPVLQAINRYLDLVHDAVEACPFGDLAQAAMEAGIVLKQRVASR